MSDLFPVDLPRFFLGEILKSERPPDGKLHPSGDLVGSLRHAQLRAAGAPMRSRAIAQSIRLMHGTIWHDWFHAALEKAGVNFQFEVDVTPWMPEGWSGTADWLFWHPEYNAWVLGDLKTTKGEAIHWIKKDGAKLEHIWQLSAYYWALVNSGRPMVHAVGVMYWPMNDTNDAVDVEPTMQEVAPIDEAIIKSTMESRWELTQAYLYAVAEGEGFINPKLHDPQERELTLVWNKKQRIFDVKLTPHWSARFCDYPDYCDCSQQGVTKVGHWTLDREYIVREGHGEDIPDVPAPSDQDYARRASEH